MVNCVREAFGGPPNSLCKLASAFQLGRFELSLLEWALPWLDDPSAEDQVHLVEIVVYYHTVTEIMNQSNQMAVRNCARDAGD